MAQRDHQIALSTDGDVSLRKQGEVEGQGGREKGNGYRMMDGIDRLDNDPGHGMARDAGIGGRTMELFPHPTQQHDN